MNLVASLLSRYNQDFATLIATFRWLLTMELTGLLALHAFVGNYAVHKDKQHWDMEMAR